MPLAPRTSLLLGLLALARTATGQEALPVASDTSAPTGSEGSEGSDGSLDSHVDTIVVSARVLGPPETPTTTATKVSREELEKFEADDVHSVVTAVPGVQVRGEDGLGLRPNIGIRGTDPNRSSKIALMEDGVLFGPAPYSAPAAYYFPMISRMTEVEVVKGGAQVRFGPNALGGAINMRTASIPFGWGADADLAVGQHGYLKAHARGGWGNERTGWLLEVIHTGIDGFKQLDGGGNTGFDKNEVMGKWRINSKPGAELFQQLEVKLGLSAETSNETYLGLSDDDFRAQPYRRYVSSEQDQMQWHRGQFVARHSLLTKKDLQVHTTAYRHQFTRDWFKVDGLAGAEISEVLANPNSPKNSIYYDVLTGQEDSVTDDETLELTDNSRWYTSQGVQMQVLSPWETGKVHHEIEGGARYHYDEVNRQHTTHPYVMRGSESGLGHIEPSGTNPNLTTQNHGSTHALSFHLLDEMNLQRFTLTPGIRVEVVMTRFENQLDPSTNNERTQVGVLPGAGAHYAFTDELGVLAGVYRGFGPVAPQPLAEGAPEPKPEESTIFEVGARWAGDSLFAELLGFFNDYDNLTAVCSESRGCDNDSVGSQFSGGQANVFGLEALISHHFRAGKWVFPSRASYTFTQSQFLEDFESDNPEWGDVQAGDELPYLPAHQGTLVVGTGWENRWSFDVTGTYASEAREIAGQGELAEGQHTDGYFLVGLAGRVRAVGPLWVYLTVKNLFDSAVLSSRRPLGARPMSPRWVQLGLKVSY